MRINADQKPQGSFGIPPEMKKAEEDFRARANAKHEAEAEEGKVEKEEEKVSEEKPLGIANPIEKLKKLGITLTDDDFQVLFFKGYVEKDIVIWPGKDGKPSYTATIKTLNAEESDLADELMMESLGEGRGKNISALGLDQRRVTAFLSFAVTRLNGKPIPANPVKFDDGSLDLKSMAEARRDIIKNLSVAHVNKLNHMHAMLTATISYIVEDPSQDFF